jgi:hypothetical protein
VDILIKFILPGILLLLTLAFGFWLKKYGRPYNGILFNIHKLVALGALAIAIYQFSNILSQTDSPGLITVLLVVAAIGVIALFATGALMSADKFNFIAMRAIHNIALAMMVIALAVAIYLLAQTP